MNIIFLLAPFSVALGLMAVGAFFWTLRSGQYDDIQGAAERILIDDEDLDVPLGGHAAVDLPCREVSTHASAQD
jgi:cbb3-type cytochrome oxidase maturation protein